MAQKSSLVFPWLTCAVLVLGTAPALETCEDPESDDLEVSFMQIKIRMSATPSMNVTVNMETNNTVATNTSAAGHLVEGSGAPASITAYAAQRAGLEDQDNGHLHASLLRLDNYQGDTMAHMVRIYVHLFVLGALMTLAYVWPKIKSYNGDLVSAQKPAAEALIADKVSASAEATPEDASEAQEHGMMRGPALPKSFDAGSVSALFQAQVHKHPDRQAVIDVPASVELTYSELESRVASLAGSLSAAGLGEGDAIAMLLTPSLQMIVATLACMRTGIAWVPMDVQAPATRLKVQIEVVDAQLAMLASDSDRLGELSSLLPVVSVTAGGELSGTLQARTRRADPLPPGIAAIFFTSGSTGIPKAVMYGHDTVLHGVLSMVQLCEMCESSRLLVKTPIVWAVCEYELFTALVVGGTAVVDSTCQRSIQNFALTITKYKISVAMTSAPVLALLAQEFEGIEHTLQQIVNVGAAMPVQICVQAQTAFGAGLKIHNIYGCTETPCTQWTFRGNADSLPELCPAGKPQCGVEVCIVGEDMKPVFEGGSGEICFGGPFLSKGYFGDKVETKKRFHERSPGKVVYRSGDIGVWVRDPSPLHKGEGEMILQIVGRKDRQLNINGIRVAAEEVEALLAQAPHVQEAAVVQAEAGDSAAMVACVAYSGRGVNAEMLLLDYCREHFAKHLRPDRIIIMQELPRLSNGKFDLKACERSANESSTIKVVDSLGMMRSMAPAQLKAKHVADNVVAVSVFAMVFFHTWQTAGGEYYFGVHLGSCFDSAWLRKIAIDWREASEWSTCGFLFAGAYLDAMAPERFEFGIREIVILGSYLVSGVLQLSMGSGNGYMWYLLMLLAAKLILVSCNRLKLSIEIQVLVFLATPLAHFVRGMAPPMEDIIGYKLTRVINVDDLMVPTKLVDLAMYGLTFLLVPDLMKPVFAWQRRAFTENMSTALCILMVASFACSVYGSSFINISFHGPLLDVLIFLPLLGACTLCPRKVHLDWVAKNALGSYVSSCLFCGSPPSYQQDVFWVALSTAVGGGNVGAIMQLFAMLSLTIAWVCVIGPATQWFMLAPIKAYQYAARVAK